MALDDTGSVPWWTEPEVTLQQILVHTLAETQRHAGHADIVRELVDGAAGLRDGNDNLPDVDRVSYVQTVEGAATTSRAGTDG